MVLKEELLSVLLERPSRQNRWLKVVANIYQFLNKIEHHFVHRLLEIVFC